MLVQLGFSLAFVCAGERVKEEGLKVICIPTSFQAKNLIIDNNLALSDLDVHTDVSPLATY